MIKGVLLHQLKQFDRNYHLKMKASRFIISEINQKFPTMPFTARALPEKRARLSLAECGNHELLQPYPVLHEKPVLQVYFGMLDALLASEEFPEEYKDDC